MRATFYLKDVVDAKMHPTGGTTGQALTKRSSVDGDVQWADVTDTPWSHFLWGGLFKSSSGFTLDVNTAQLMGGYAKGSALGDYLEWDIYLPAGSWDITMFGVRNTDSGIISVQLDGAEQGTADAWGGAMVYNYTWPPILAVVATSSKKTLRLKTIAQNPSSSGHAARITAVYLQRVE